MSIFIDFNRHTFLQYRDNGKTRSYVSMVDGTIDCVQLSAKDFRLLKPYTKTTPEHFAQTYLNSHLGISRSARSILRGILGDTGGEIEERSDPRFSSGLVTLEEIAAGNNWNPSHCRKFLRKAMDKPGGRWTFSPDDADKVVEMLKEYFSV